MGIEQECLPGLDPSESGGGEIDQIGLPVRRKMATDRGIKLQELMVRPLTLDLREQIGFRINDLIQGYGISLMQIMSQERASILTWYTAPDEQQNRWLSQKEVMERLSGDPRTSKFRIPFWHGCWRLGLTLTVLENAQAYMHELNIGWAPKPITLLLPEDDFLLTAAVRENIATVEEMSIIPDALVVKICQARSIYQGLERAMQRYYPDWERTNIMFHQELPP